MSAADVLAAGRPAAAHLQPPPSANAAGDLLDRLPKESASIEDEEEEEWVPYGADFLRHPLRHLEGAVFVW